MRYRRALASLLVIAATTLPTAGQSGIADEIRELTMAVNAAYAANDLDKYFSYYAADLTQWWPSGRVSLEAYRTQWTAFVKGGGRVEAADVSDLQVQVDASGNTAVATYRLNVRTRSAKGEVSGEENQETDVWFRRDGRWQIVHLHYSPARAAAR